MKHTQEFLYSARYFCPILAKFWDSRQIFVEVSKTKFYHNLSRESRADVCGQADGYTDITKLAFAKAP
jgi:hypothetical protein